MNVTLILVARSRVDGIGDVDVMCNSFAYFHECCYSPTKACDIVAAFVLLHMKPQFNQVSGTAYS